MNTLPICSPVSTPLPHGGIRGLKSTLAVTLSLFCWAAVHAQEEVYELSPFEVSTDADRGYQSFSSNSGTRLSVQLRDLPMSVDVLNREFIEDTGSTNLDEALRYSAGVFSSDTASGARAGANPGGSAEFSPSVSGGFSAFSNTLNIRGFNIPNQQRLGFRVGGSIAEYGVNLGGLLDSQNIERIEVVRGPQALLYGVSVISGVVNVIPKRPLPEQRQSANFSFGSDNFRRGGIDVTGPTGIVDALDYRVLVSASEKDDWTQFRNTSTRYGALQLLYSPKPRTSYFFEIQAGNERHEGIGPQALYDSGSQFENRSPTAAQSIVENLFPVVYRNEYGEYYDWARDQDAAGPEFHSQFNDQYPFGDYGPGYRISGPDTYFERDEVNLLFDASVPLGIEGLDGKFGVFYSHQESESRNLNLRTDVYQNNNPNRPDDLRTPFETLFTYGTDTVPEGLSRPDARRYELMMVANNEYRVGRYFWQNDMNAGDSLQVRLDVNYEWNTAFPWGSSGSARHNLLAGYQYTLDDIDYSVGTPLDAFIDTEGPRDDQSPVQYRSIFDFSPIRYNGEPVAPPGALYQNSELWYHGIFGVYQGRFFDERMLLIVGMRRDIYNGRTHVYDRPGDAVTTPTGGQLLQAPLFFPAPDGNWIPTQTGAIFNPAAGTHRKDYNSDNLRRGFLSAGEALNSGRNFASDIVEDTFTIALSYRLNDAWSVFGVRSEGISPNTGLVDGNNDFFEAERTTSYELGLKFDLLDERISGQVSAFRIERTNAIWQFRQAPAPGRWATGSIPAVRGAPPFDPRLAFDRQPGEAGYAPVNYPVHESFFSDQWEWAQDLEGFSENGALLSGSELPEGVFRTATLLGGSETYHYIDYTAIQNPQTPHEVALRQAVLQALQTPTEAQGFAPIAHGIRTAEIEANNNASQSGRDLNGREGAFVPFEDETQGIDAQVTVNATRNWQMLLNFSYLEREATSSFDLLPTEYNGNNVGTEFDEWVYVLGLDAFSDTDYSDGLDPSTHDSGGIKGVDLLFNPSVTASFWNKYVFSEGPLEGLAVGGGVLYRGSSQTAIPVGGTNLVENRYPTPDLPSRTTVDAYLSYGMDWKDTRILWRLNVYNLFDHRKSESVVTYDAPETLSGTQTRRSLSYHAPRSYRVTMELEF